MFTNTSIKFRLVFVLSMMTVLLVGVGAVGLYGFNQSNASLKSVYEDRTVTSVQLGSILDVWYQVRENAKNAIESKNTATAKALGEEANKLVRQNEGVWAKYLETYLTPEEVVLTKTKGEQHVQYVQSMNRTIQLASAGEFEVAAQNLASDTVPKFNALRDTVFALLDLQGKTAEIEYAHSQNSYEVIFMALIATILAGAILLIRPDLSVNQAAYLTRASWKNFFTRSGDFSRTCMCSVVAAFSLALVRTGTFV